MNENRPILSAAKNVDQRLEFLATKVYVDICGASLDSGHQMRMGLSKMAIFAQYVTISRIRCILETKLL